MRKFILIFFILLSFTFFLLSCGIKNKISNTYNYDKETTYLSSSNTIKDQSYKENISTFQSVLPKNFEKSISEHNYVYPYYVYFGRESCPYCVEFAAKLSKQANEKQIPIHYIDTENKQSKGLQKIREEYNINTVPQLLKIVNEKNDFQLIDTEKNIIDF